MKEHKKSNKVSVKKRSGSNGINRRRFMKATMTAAATVAGILSLEEQILLAGQTSGNTTESSNTGNTKLMTTGKIRDLEISRLICGGNLISGYAHSRDLIYVSALLKNYFTDEKIMDTWAICESNGVNACTIYAGDKRAINLFQRYKNERGGKMKWLSQTEPNSQNIERTIDQLLKHEPAAIYLAGNIGDRWTFEGRIDLIEKFINYVKKQGVPAGVASHSIDTPIAVDTAGIDVDFYMKTLHSNNYWSKRRPDQYKNVIDNYDIDNYWDKDPEITIKLMSEIKKPWIGYKVLAAGAIHPRDGFRFAFENGVDFACVGMFDWQVAGDVNIAQKIIENNKNRKRPWYV